jgi:2-polyprenyl-6-hydroxyphenyl methylase/3-demethylubiquinone-9 3-methyltransferase
MEGGRACRRPADFIEALAARLAPGGLMILSTPNRTAWSKLLTITLAEGFGQIPKGTHDYDKFIDPDTMRGLLAHAGWSASTSKASR